MNSTVDPTGHPVIKYQRRQKRNPGIANSIYCEFWRLSATTRRLNRVGRVRVRLFGRFVECDPRENGMFNDLIDLESAVRMLLRHTQN
jgi:hypothetical protein